MKVPLLRMNGGSSACGMPNLPRLGEQPMVVFGHRHGQRRALVAPVGDQLVERLRVDHRARQDVGADLAAFFEHADAELALPLGRELLEPDRRGEARGPAADDDDVILHGFAFAHRSSRRADQSNSARACPANSLTAPSMVATSREWVEIGRSRARPRRRARCAGGSRAASTPSSRRKRATGSRPRPKQQPRSRRDACCCPAPRRPAGVSRVACGRSRRSACLCKVEAGRAAGRRRPGNHAARRDAGPRGSGLPASRSPARRGS